MKALPEDTEACQKTLAFIKKKINLTGESPTLREISVELGWGDSFPQSGKVPRVIRTLRKKGLIRKVKFRQRGIEIVEEEDVAKESRKENLKKRLKLHALWCAAEAGGEEISLVDEDLEGVNLSYRNLRHVDMSGANLAGADLRCCDLTGACMSGCDLRGANLNEIEGKQIYQFFFGKDYGYYVDGELTIGERSHPIEYWAAHSLRILKEMRYTYDEIALHNTIIKFIADTKA